MVRLEARLQYSIYVCLGDVNIIRCHHRSSSTGRPSSKPHNHIHTYDPSAIQHPSSIHHPNHTQPQPHTHTVQSCPRSCNNASAPPGCTRKNGRKSYARPWMNHSRLGSITSLPPRCRLLAPRAAASASKASSSLFGGYWECVCVESSSGG